MWRRKNLAITSRTELIYIAFIQDLRNCRGRQASNPFRVLCALELRPPDPQYFPCLEEHVC